MATKKAAKYSSASIKNLQFPENVRHNPTMYVGPLAGDGLFSILREVMDNAVDEALAERCSVLHVHLEPKANVYTVLDNGAGIPVGPIIVKDAMDKKHKVSALKAAVGMLSTSGKYNDEAYATSRGVHGLGVKLTNALSTKFEVWTKQGSDWYYVAFAKGLETTAVKKTKAPKNPYNGKLVKKGTVIRFSPELSLFKAKVFPPEMLHTWAEIAAIFTPGFKIHVTTGGGTETQNKKVRTFEAPNGPVGAVADMVEKLGAVPLAEKNTFVSSNALIDCVVQFTNHSSENLSAYTNGLWNRDAGFHVASFYKALQAALEPHKKRGVDFTLNDLHDGIVGMLNAKMSHPQFSSQDKVKLVDERAGAPLQEHLTADLKKFFAKNKALALAICQQAAANMKLKHSFKVGKEAARRINRVVKNGFPAKAVVCHYARPEERELILVEGESAAGPAKAARYKQFQELLPLKGKPANAERTAPSTLFKSEQIINIFAMLGYNTNAKPGEDPLAKLRVGKVIILADADPDGPLAGNTPLRIRANGKIVSTTMSELCTDEVEGVYDHGYEVMTWTGDSFAWVPGRNCRVATFTNTFVDVEFDDGSSVLCTENHEWCLYSQVQHGKATQTLQVGLQTIKARDLVEGDRIAFASSTNRTRQLAVTGAPVSNGAQPNLEMKELKVKSITMRIDDDQPFYCLYVPTFHNFVLDNGAVSKNCHISVLLLTLFAKYMPSLFDRGIIHIAMTKPYYAYRESDDALVTGDTAKQVQDQCKELGMKPEAHHIKGWGEVDPPLLKILAFNPATRHLAKIAPWGSPAEATKFRELMGSDTEARKELIGLAN